MTTPDDDQTPNTAWPGFVLPAGDAKPSRSPLVWVVPSVAVVLLALIVWLVARPSSPGPERTTTAPTASLAAPIPSGPFPPFTEGVPDFISQPAWSPALSLEFPGGVWPDHAVSAQRGDIVILSGADAAASEYFYEAVDASSLQVLWRLSYDTPGNDNYVQLYADEGGLVFSHYADGAVALDVVDTLTGEIFATVTLDRYESVVAVESGFIVTEGSYSFCARVMTNPGTCRWKVPDVFLLDVSNPTASDNLFIFGGGEWVNTGQGVVELATGKAASFGADVKQGDETEPMVYYTGDSADRIFRVDCLFSSGGDTDCHFQPWDVKADKACGPAVTALTASVSPGQDIFVAIAQAADGSSIQVKAYSWDTGEMQWQIAHDCGAGFCYLPDRTTGFAGNIYVLGIYEDSLFVDLQTGQEMVPDGSDIFSHGPTYVFIGQQVLYLAENDTMIAYDTSADGLPQLWSLSSPAYDVYKVFTAGHHIFAASFISGQLWVLQQ